MAFRPHYQAVLTIPALALESAMTCRVHRAVILGLIADSERNTAPLPLTTFIPETIPETTASIDDRALMEYGFYNKYESGDPSGEVEYSVRSRSSNVVENIVIRA